MPRKPIDYSQTVIYKICCKELTVKEVYVGSTTSIVKRRCGHKYNCNNEKDKKYNSYVYQFIREHGGFENWDVIVIEEYPCENNEQKRTRERYWYEELKAELNSNRPLITIQEAKEEKKEYDQEYSINNAGERKEYKATYYIKNVDKIAKKASQIITCICGATPQYTYKSKHLLTAKHLNFIKLNPSKTASLVVSSA
jgi:hypothetical protein